MEQSLDNSTVLETLRAGGEQALARLFEEYSGRLKRMVKLRMDRRLQGRLDPSDVIQESYLEVARRFRDYLTQPDLPFYLWLRFLTGQKLIDLHRRHLGTKMRDVGQEVSLRRGAFPEASSVSLAAQLLGQLTSASQAMVRAETQVKVQEALNAMDALDREVLTLRHFELLSNDETAAVLGITKQAASNRFVRALKRLRSLLEGLPELRGAFPGAANNPSVPPPGKP